MTGGVYFFPKMLLLTVHFGIKSVQFGRVKKELTGRHQGLQFIWASILVSQNLHENVPQ